MLNNFIDIIAAPRQFFNRLKEKPGWLLPWLVVAILAATVQWGFYSTVDPEFLLDQLVEQSLRPGVSESDLRATLEGTVENRSMLAIASSVGVFIGLLVVFAISASYLYLISKFSENGITFKHWYSLVAWCAIPSVFTALAAWVLILGSGGMMELAALSPLNLNYLLFRSEGTYASLLNLLDLMTIWALVLTILGYKSFMQCSTFRATVVVAAPYILILGIWALIIAL